MPHRRLLAPFLVSAVKVKARPPPSQIICGPLSRKGLSRKNSLAFAAFASLHSLRCTGLIGSSLLWFLSTSWQCPIQGQIPIVDSSSSTNHRVFRMVLSTPCLISVHFTDVSDNHLVEDAPFHYPPIISQSCRGQMPSFTSTGPFGPGPSSGSCRVKHTDVMLV